MENSIKLALLIDAENISPKYHKSIFEDLASLGNVTIKRIYGNWTSERHNGWKETLQEYAITPIQQFSNTTGKNASDSALIIDAMDILYSKHVEGFCIVSSDSDFTRLASRLREAGMKVFGLGEEKTPQSFVKACDKFLYLDFKGKEKKLDEDVISRLYKSIDDLSCENGDGIVSLSDLGKRMLQIDPSFAPRNYGHSSLIKIVRSREDVFDIVPNEKGDTWYVKNKNANLPLKREERGGIKKAVNIKKGRVNKVNGSKKEESKIGEESQKEVINVANSPQGEKNSVVNTSQKIASKSKKYPKKEQNKQVKQNPNSTEPLKIRKDGGEL